MTFEKNKKLFFISGNENRNFFVFSLVCLTVFANICLSNGLKSKYFLSKPQCNERLMNETDSNVVKLMCFGEGGRELPENHSELKPFCK